MFELNDAPAVNETPSPRISLVDKDDQGAFMLIKAYLPVTPKKVTSKKGNTSLLWVDFGSSWAPAQLGQSIGGKALRMRLSILQDA